MVDKKKENQESSNKIIVEVESELAVCENPAYVKVFLGKKLIVHIVGAAEFEKGADGKMYPVVKLTLKNP